MKLKSALIDSICLLLIILFTYASINKLMDHEQFSLQLSKSPMLYGISGVVSWSIPTIELAISILLISTKTRRVGLIASFTLVLTFSWYLFTILRFSEYVPCSCGGILERLSWPQHLVFNLFFVVLAGVAIILDDVRAPFTKEFRHVGKMRKMTFILLGLCFVCSALAVFTLFGMTYDSKTKYSSFERKHAKHSIPQIRTYDLGYNSYYFAGTDSTRVYLANQVDPYHMVSSTFELADTHHIRLRTSTSGGLRRPLVTVMGSHFFLMDGVTPIIERGIIGNWISEPVFRKQPFFNAIVPLEVNSFAVRTVSSDHTYWLGKSIPNPPYIKWVRDILIKQIDGLFCVDGMMHYNQQLNKIIYVYYYRNQYIVMDTTLRLIYYGQSIDSISQAKIRVSSNKEGNYFTKSGQSLLVNRLSFSNSSFLYINSAIAARNEDADEFDHSSRIDVYDLTTANYLSSFYIPDQRGHKIQGFTISGKKLFGLFDRYLVGFELSGLLSELSDHSKK